MFLGLAFLAKGPYIYDVHTKGGWVDPEICTCLPIILFLENRFIVHFCKWKWSFFFLDKCMTPKITIKNEIQINQIVTLCKLPKEKYILLVSAHISYKYPCNWFRSKMTKVNLVHYQYINVLQNVRKTLQVDTENSTFNCVRSNLD